MAEDAFLIAPQCPEKQGWAGKNAEVVLALIDDVSKEFRIDKNRIYVTTGNGVAEDLMTVPAPNAPSLLCLDRDSGKVLWSRSDLRHCSWAHSASSARSGFRISRASACWSRQARCWRPSASASRQCGPARCTTC